jgi:hypothetical protein
MKSLKIGVLFSAGVIAVAAVATTFYFIAALAIRLNGWSHSQQVLFTGCE